jgi:hypothetical protein
VLRSGVCEDRVEAEVGTVEEGGEFGEAESEAFRGSSAKCDVAQFAGGAMNFSIKVQVGIGNSENFRGFGEVADQIEHGAMAKGCR